ncbi:MAG: tetratricopeptide repeat protein [Bacteroidota bacterium]
MKKKQAVSLLFLMSLSLVFFGFDCSQFMTTGNLALSQAVDPKTSAADRLKLFAKADSFFTLESKANPKNEMAWFRMGQARYELKRYLGMKEAFDKAIEVSNAHKKEIDNLLFQAWAINVNRGSNLYNDSDVPDSLKLAIEYLEASTKLMPDSIQGYYNLAVTYIKMGDEKSAEKIFESTFNKFKDIKSAKSLGRLPLNRAIKLQEEFMQDNKDVMEEWNKIKSLYVGMNSSDVTYYLGQPTTKKPVAAKAGAKKDKNKPADEEWNFQKYNLSVEVSGEKVTKLSSKYVPQVDSSKYKGAMIEYDRAIAVYANANKTFSNDAEITDNLSIAYIQSGKRDLAKAFLLQKVEKDPSNKYDRYTLGVFYLKDKKFQDAINEFEAAVALDPEFFDAIYNIGATYVDWANDDLEANKKKNSDDKSYVEKYKKAVPYLEKFAEKNSDKLSIWDLLGQVYANAGQVDKADKAFKKADEIRSGKN